MTKKIIIIAGNRGEYYDYLSSMSKDLHEKYVCAEFAHDIQHVQAESVVVIGTARERGDYEQMLRLAHSKYF